MIVVDPEYEITSPDRMYKKDCGIEYYPLGDTLVDEDLDIVLEEILGEIVINENLRWKSTIWILGV